jgi:hypothetical protein
VSAGPAPVSIPRLVGTPAGQARATLTSLHLRARLTDVPAPGTAPGVVTAQAPTAGARLLPGGIVSLSAAETPSWRTVTTFSGHSSVPFKTRGARWRIVYSMAYDGTCTFVFFCSGPTATVVNPSTRATASEFDLSDGGQQVKAIGSGPGLYQVTVAPGSDSASWSIEVQDYY